MPSTAPVRSNLRRALGATTGLPQALTFLPALTLGAFWLGGERALLATALTLPLAAALIGGIRPSAPAAPPITGIKPRQAVIDALDYVISGAGKDGMTTACLAIGIEGMDDVANRYGQAAADTAAERIVERLGAVLRSSDIIGRLDDTRFAIALGPLRRVDLESLLQIAGRLQDAVREPISIDATRIHVSSVIGFCLPKRSPDRTGTAMLAAAEAALRDAQQNGAGAIRSFSPEMQLTYTIRNELVDQVAEALDSGQIRPWFQPQTSTDTGAVTGFEALSRWPHPERGLIPPSEFLPAIEQTGLSERLSEEILFHALTALRCWDKAGLNVPSVGVNFSSDELRNPGLTDRIKWELDRFDLCPDRLTVEILETVVSDSGDDVVIRNIAALSDLGCRVDLDDFGTGNASIGAIRRFAVHRLKIDRSFVTQVDQDREQQDMVATILMMAERLGLDTLAEGVERVGEHSMLAQLGCQHVQGFGVARPMPFEDTIAWMRKHNEKLASATRLGRHAS